jgi:hypothetical protein
LQCQDAAQTGARSFEDPEIVALRVELEEHAGVSDNARTCVEDAFQPPHLHRFDSNDFAEPAEPFETVAIRRQERAELRHVRHVDRQDSVTISQRQMPRDPLGVPPGALLELLEVRDDRLE